jgi:lipoate-protein ligase A
MALDEGLLEWVRTQSSPVLVLRTYGWQTPTLSLGVHQKVRDIHFLLNFYGKDQSLSAVVRRPTGGRAILHGHDISYAFITNAPEILRLSLKASYSIYAGITQRAFEQLGIQTCVADSAGGRDYLRSPVCFETHTPWDLVSVKGQKISGSAQLRRSGGLLQHGAAFLAGYQIEEPLFFEALCQVVAERFQLLVTTISPLEAQALVPDWLALQAAYRKSSLEILESASTTKGSHLVPASV